MTEEFSYAQKDDRFRIVEFRSRVIMQVIALSLAANAIPIALGSLFQLGPSSTPPWNWFWYGISVGWIALAVSVLAGVVFITSAPNWAENYSRGRVLNLTYVACVSGLFVGAAGFAVAAFITVLSAMPSPPCRLAPCPL